MRRSLIVTALTAVVAAAPLAASPADDFDRLNVVAAAAPAAAASLRTPADVLDDIDALLGRVYRDMGNRYEVVVQKDTDEDREWQAKYEDYNLELKALWSEYSSALSASVDSRRRERDEAFRRSVASSFNAYRSLFGALAEDPSRTYSQVVGKAEQARLTLRVDVKMWFDKTVRLTSGVSKLSSWSGDPTKWDNDEVAYSVGLLPRDLLGDVNATVKSAYLYGYVNKMAALDSSDSVVSSYSFLPASSLTWDYACPDENLFYDRVYGSSLVGGSLSQEFRATSPRGSSLESDAASMQKARTAIDDAISRAEAFKAANPEITTNSKGQMYLPRTVDKAKAAEIVQAYGRIAQDFKAAMDDYHRFLVNFRSNFPGTATATLQDEFRQAFTAYRTDFTYGEIDGLDLSFRSLKDRAARFKLNRKGGFLGAADRRLVGPGLFATPRRDLYSAQRVIALLPAEMVTMVNARRNSAFIAGQWDAEKEYDRRHPAPTAEPVDDDSWNDTVDSNDGGTWNDSPATNDGGSWND